MIERFLIAGLIAIGGHGTNQTQAAAPPQQSSVEKDNSNSEASTPVELGKIDWQRDFEAAQRLAIETHRPMLVLFDEVPGCATCQNFGREVLSHPIVVDAAAQFIPVLIRNNVGRGGDRKLLERFNEPAWNNPVVRMMRADGTDLVPRETGDWTAATLIRRMTAALHRSGQTVPRWLRLVDAEWNPAEPNTATVAMACYWEGELQLGGIEGVIGSSIGMLDGREVVEVRFDAKRVSFRDLIDQAKQMRCTNRVYARNKEQAEQAAEIVGKELVVETELAVDDSTQQQVHLYRRPEYYLLPLTASQATKLNSLLAHAPRRLDDTKREQIEAWLSPTQRRLTRQLAAYLPKHGYVRGFEQKLDRSEIRLDRSAKGTATYFVQLESLLNASK